MLADMADNDLVNPLPNEAVADDGVPVGALAKLAAAGLVVAAVAIFVLQNLDSVPVDFLSWSFDAPLILLLAIAAVAGVLVRWLIGFLRGRKRRKR